MDSDLNIILFADDTTLWHSDSDLIKLVSQFKLKFEKISSWIKSNNLFINWSKTKFMFITSGRMRKCTLPENIFLENKQVEVVNEFKLLGCILDSKLTFNQHFKNLRATILKKLFAIKRIFFLSEKIKVQFFKTFILPHFDYCASLFIYFTKTLITSHEKLYNLCLFHLVKLELNSLSIDIQAKTLEKFQLLPYCYRIFKRFAFFAFKITNKKILKIFQNKQVLSENEQSTRDLTRNIYYVPLCKSKSGQKSLSVSLPSLVNKVLRLSFNLSLQDFTKFINLNFAILFNKFKNCILV